MKMTKEKETELIMQLAEDVAPFVRDVESGIKTTRNNYGRYGMMLTRLSKGNRKMAYILGYAASGQGVNDALRAFFPE
jgi:hypothetical protein